MRNTFALAGVLLLAALWPAEAQVTTATFYGVLTDPSGARIPGAVATLTHEGTGTVSKQVADSAGEFGFDFLPVGTYTLRIESAGFKVQERKGIVLASGQQVRQTFVLDVGSVNETVSIAGTAPLVDTVSSQQHQTFDSRAVSQLPLSRRNISNILGLENGVDVAGGNRGVRINGAGKSGAGISVDGTDANSNPEGRGISQYGGENYIDVMSIEGVEEVQVVSGVLPAEYGGVMSGQVNLITKSGTNLWHGSLIHAYQSHLFNARNPFTPNRAADGVTMLRKPRIVFNQFGGSAGGPIIRDKLFVFGTYEGYRESSSVAVSGNVPTDSFRADILRALPFAETKLLLGMIPEPTQIRNADQGLYQGIRSAHRKDNNFVVKGDYHVTSSGTLSITFTRDRPFYLQPTFYLDGANDRTFLYNQDRVTASYIAGTGTWTSETRFGANISDMSRVDALFLVKDPSNAETGPWGRRIGQITLSGTSGFSTPSSELWSLDGPSYTVDQKFAHRIGKHSLKFGGRYMFTGGSRSNPQNPSFAYTSKDDLLNNIPSSINASFGAAPHRSRMFEMGFFTQDDWRVTPNLVVNLGLRYDFYGHAIVEPSTNAKVGIYNLTPPKDWAKFDFGAFSDPLHPYNNDGWVNLGPRVGFAYTFGGGKNVIRSGVGVLFSSNIPAVVRQGAADPVVPFRSIWAKQEAVSLGLRWPMYNDQFRSIVQATAAQTGSLFVFSVLNPGLQDPYTIQMQFNIQRQVTSTTMVETGYAGNRGVKLPLQRMFNQVDRITGLRPNPALGAPGGYYVDNSQNSAYHAWQSSLRQRLTHNLSFEAHYTFSKALAVTGGDIGAYFQGDSNSVQQEFAYPRADRGPAAGDTRHRFVADWVYEVPYSSHIGNKALRQVLGGWEVTGVLNARTGGAVDLTQTCGSSRYCRPDYTGAPVVLDNWQHNFDLNTCSPGINCGMRYLNTAAFSPVPISSVSGVAIRPGNLGYAILRAPGSWTINSGLGRNFNLSERIKLTLRADMYNALNHVNYGGPTASINSSTFGEIRSAGAMRSMQMNARMTW